MNRGLLGPVKRSAAAALPSMVGVERRIGFVSSAAVFTTTSTTSVDVTGMSVTVLHTRTGLVHYRFHAPSCRSSVAGAYLGVKLLQDATTLDQAFHTSSAATEWGGLDMDAVYQLAAGIYVFKVQAASSSGASTAALNDNSLGVMSLAIYEDVA